MNLGHLQLLENGTYALATQLVQNKTARNFERRSVVPSHGYHIQHSDSGEA